MTSPADTTEFPLDEYLARIQYTGPTAPAESTLFALHRAQAYAIPFENLNPLAGLPVNITPVALIDKLVRNRRGGYCFELNGLFSHVLRHLGFDIRTLCARVAISPGNYGTRAHQITLVDVGDKRFIADVGFGGNCPVDPILLEDGHEVDQFHDRFRMSIDPDYGWRLDHFLDGNWRTNYAFSLDPYLPADYHLLNHFTSSAPDSNFTKIPIICRVTPEARAILVGNSLKFRRPGHETTRVPVDSSDALRIVLHEVFEIDFPENTTLPEPIAPPAGFREI